VDKAIASREKSTNFALDYDRVLFLFYAKVNQKQAFRVYTNINKK